MHGIQIYSDLHFKAHNSDLQIQIHIFNQIPIDQTKYFFLEVCSIQSFKLFPTFKIYHKLVQYMPGIQCLSYQQQSLRSTKIYILNQKTEFSPEYRFNFYLVLPTENT